MTSLWKVNTVLKQVNGEWANVGERFYNPAKITTIYLADDLVWRVNLVGNEFFFVEDNDNAPKLGSLWEVLE